MSRLILLVFVAIMVLIAGCSWHAPGASLPGPFDDVTSEAQDYSHEVGVATKNGYPLNLTDFAKPFPPANQNAAILYDAFNHSRVRDQDSKLELSNVLDPLYLGRMPTQKQLDDAKTALSENANLLKLAHQAVSRPKCVFNTNWSTPDPANILTPDLFATRDCVILISAESVEMASEGKGEEAVQNEALNFRIADQAAGAPRLIGYYVSRNLNSLTLTGMQKIIYITHGDPKVARLVETTIERDFHPHNLATAEEGEVAFDEGCVKYLRAHDLKTLMTYNGDDTYKSIRSPHWGWWGLPTWNQFMDASGAILLREQMKLIKSADKPYPEAQAADDAVQTELQSSDQISHYLAKMMIPISHNGPAARTRLQAEVGETEAGAAVLSWKGAHGSYPTKLSQAMAKVPIDPFDGKPLRYKREGPGFVVYSVGPTGKFDGGTPSVRPPLPAHGVETMFRYPVPAYLAAKN